MPVEIFNAAIHKRKVCGIFLFRPLARLDYNVAYLFYRYQINVRVKSCRIESEFTFAAKTQHKLTVTVNKSSSGLNISIESWLIDDTEYTGDAK